ncbi:hypothetical protein M9Y10_023155 [Tritrichomonas musculus]|uniref:Leucine Rich Repeat family protein n=1 Tax=Tritrichomonas musculus TaxID=1915356 RepID=A0ABR2KUI4_9EUKA
MSKYPSIEDLATKTGASVLYCKKAAALSFTNSTKKSQKNKKKINSKSYKKILLISDCFIELWDLDETFGKKAFWFDLIKIDVNTEDNYFLLEFANVEPFGNDTEDQETNNPYFILELTNKEGNLTTYYQTIIQLVQRIFTKEEIRNLIFFDEDDLYDDEEYFEKYSFTPRGAFARFLILNMKKKDGILSQTVKESVARYILMKYNNIYIENEFNIENCLDIFLSSIKPLKYIESVSIPEFSKFIQVDSLNIIANFLKKASNIQHIEIRGPCPKAHFHDLCRSIENMGILDIGENNKNSTKDKRKSQCKLSAITFNNFELNTKQIASIKTAAISSRLLSLGINNIKTATNSNTNTNPKPSENDVIIDYMIDTLLAPHLTSTLRILSLDGNHDMDIQKMIENSGSIQKLSLKNCGLELTYVFEILASIQTNIDSIDLSGNSCTNSDIDKAITSLRHPLLRIDVNNVKWSDNCLTNFLRGIVKVYEFTEKTRRRRDDEEEEEEEENNDKEDNDQKRLKDKFLNSEENVNSGLNSTLVTLSLSYVEASKSEWQNVRTFFEDNRKKVTLEQFSWNGNKISSHFIIFLKNMKRIRRLFLNNCPNFSLYSSSLATNFISKSETLSELYIEKADSSSFPEDSSFSTFFKKCRNSTSLRLLNVRHCNIGSEGLVSLANLIVKCQSGKLNQVAFDGCGCEALDDIYNFVEICQNFYRSANKKSKKSKKNKSDTLRLFIELPSYDLRTLKVPEEDIEQMKGDLTDLTRSPKEVDDLWVTPFEFYCMQKNDEFPTYFHPSIVSKIRKEQEKNAEKERSIRKRNSTSNRDIRKSYNDRNKNKNNFAKSYRNNANANFLYVGRDEISDSDEEVQNNKGKTWDLNKSKYDEELENDAGNEDDDEVDQEIARNIRNRNIERSKKKKNVFRFNDWQFPVSTIDNVDELNENMIIRLQDRFSLRQLISEATNKKDDNPL